MMRIALLHSLPDANRRSMDIYHDELAQSLRGCLKPQDKLISFPRNAGGVLNGETGKLGRYWQHYFRYGRLAKKIDADLFHITDHGYGNVIPFLHGKKTVITFHDALLPRLAEGRLPVKNKPWSAIAAQYFALSCMKSAAHVITDSEFSRREFLSCCTGFPENRVTTVPLGIHRAFFRPVSEEEKTAFRTKWKLPQGAPLVLLTGRTDPHKNMEGALKTFKEFRVRYGMRAALIKTGSPFTPAQRSLIKELEMTHEVYELGGLPFEEVPAVYQSSAALLFLSFYEGFGFPVLEAMASGIPAVISNCGSLPEIAGGAAIFADPQNPEAAAESLYKVLTDSVVRQHLIGKGKKHAATFTWEETARKTMAIYRKVLE